MQGCPTRMISHVHQVHGVFAKDRHQAHRRFDSATANRKVHGSPAADIPFKSVTFELNKVVCDY